MKKFLLCMMLAGLMMPVIAQEKLTFERKSVVVSEMRADLGLSSTGMLPMSPKGALVDVKDWIDVGTSNGYDRQSQGSVYPMTRIHDDGFIGMTWTNEDNTPFPGSSTPARGVGYAYSTDGGKTWSEPDMRVGGIPVYWPSYAQWGKEGEAILARSYDSYEHQGVQILDGLVLMTREKKGEGEWTLHAVPYPAGTPIENGYFMAWSRMTTSGEDHQYIHFMTHTRWGDNCDPAHYYEGYCEPIFYYRTSDGGETWDVAGKLVPDEISSMAWDRDDDPSFVDRISITAQGDVVAATFIDLGCNAYLLKSQDNGNTWTATEFFHSPVRWYSSPAAYADTCFIPTFGTVAIDNNGMAHIAFGTRMCMNSADAGFMSLFSGYGTAYLSYWNEDMDPFDGDDFTSMKMDEILYETFIDPNQSESGKIYVQSITPLEPVVGFFTPTLAANIFTAPETPGDFDWIQNSYGRAGTFSFPQIGIDKDNKLHLTYLGMLDGGSDDTRWLRHPYYTSRTEDGTWSETEYIVNNVDVIDREFAYLTSAGLYDNKMHLMAQVDPYAGTYLTYAGEGSDHNSVLNHFYYFYLEGGINYPASPIGAIDEIVSLNMSLLPNPASGQVRVKFEGKGNITVSNMLGQTVYHVENVENQKEISLSNMATGVYFVTVRSGNATATQKLIVK